MSRPTPMQKDESKLRSKASVYDAVAGRISTGGFIPAMPRASRYRDELSTNVKPIAPEEVLFKRKRAPERYEETDVYFAHEKLSSKQRLPDSDLLKAIHQFTSTFYAETYASRARGDYRSMDETALIAMGILLEEAMAETLGDNGDLVFTEPEEYSQGIPEDGVTSAQVTGSVPIIHSPQFIGEESSEESDHGHRSKRARSDLGSHRSA